MARPDLSIAVYGDVNLNLIDGSAIWVQSVVEAFSGAGCRVRVVLKAPITTTRLTDHIARLPRVTVTAPFEERLLPDLSNALSPRQAHAVLELLDDDERFDIIVLRGLRVAHDFAGRGRFRGRMWTYLTDIPQTLGEMDLASRDTLTTVADASEIMLCQTEELRSFLESTVHTAAAKSLLFPPVVPAVDVEAPSEPPTRRSLRLVYSGKFAPRWKTLEMMRLPADLAARGIRASLDVVGDKIHADPHDVTYAVRMRAALQSSGVRAHGGVSRQEAMRLSAQGHVGMSWRDPSLDTSLELSTKVLEFGSLGVPVVLNRTRPHEDLLGRDYPLFANSYDEVLALLDRLVDAPAMWHLAAERCAAASQEYRIERAVDRVSTYLDRTRPRPSATPRARALRVVVASHDLKFFTKLLDHLERVPQLEIRVDHWSALAVHDERASKDLVEWADVVICEWCGPNAIWYSKHKRANQRLIVRLHRFELDAGYGRQVAIDNVDQVVCVSPHYADLTRTQLGWPTDKVVVIPNWVDVLQLDRPKYSGARFHLGMIGVGERRKRLDVALDVVELVRREDARFVLFAKTKMPWDYWWIWKREEERAHLDDVLRRIQKSPLLRGAVVFDGFGPDVGAWLRKIGFVLSTSDDESFHLAPAEGMAARTVPVVRAWEGATTIYAERWVHRTPDAMASAIVDLSASDAWTAAGAAAHDDVKRAYDLRVVQQSWLELVTATSQRP